MKQPSYEEIKKAIWDAFNRKEQERLKLYNDGDLSEKYPIGVTPCSDGWYVINSGSGPLLYCTKAGVDLFNEALKEESKKYL